MSVVPTDGQSGHVRLAAFIVRYRVRFAAVIVPAAAARPCRHVRISRVGRGNPTESVTCRRRKDLPWPAVGRRTPTSLRRPAASPTSTSPAPTRRARSPPTSRPPPTPRPTAAATPGSTSSTGTAPTRHPTSEPENLMTREPARTADGLLSRSLREGVVAGAVGVAVMTLGEKVEQRFSGRPDSYMPARVLERLLRLPEAPGR